MTGEELSVLTYYFVENNADPTAPLGWSGSDGEDCLMVLTGITVAEVGKLRFGWMIADAAAMALGWHAAIIRDYGYIEYPDGTRYPKVNDR